MGNATTNGIEKHIDSFEEKDRMYGLINVSIRLINRQIISVILTQSYNVYSHAWPSRKE
jgi:hypothetical protein